MYVVHQNELTLIYIYKHMNMFLFFYQIMLQIFKLDFLDLLLLIFYYWQ